MQSISYRETIDIVTCTQFLSNVESRAHVEVICVVAYYLVLMIIMDSVLKSAIQGNIIKHIETTILIHERTPGMMIPQYVHTIYKYLSSEMHNVFIN